MDEQSEGTGVSVLWLCFPLLFFTLPHLEWEFNLQADKRSQQLFKILCPNIQRKRRDHFFFFIHKSRQYYNKSPCIHHPAPKGINLEPLLLNLYSILLSLAMFLRTKECFSKVLFKKEKLERSFGLLWFFPRLLGTHLLGLSVGSCLPQGVCKGGWVPVEKYNRFC